MTPASESTGAGWICHASHFSPQADVATFENESSAGSGHCPVSKLPPLASDWCGVF